MNLSAAATVSVLIQAEFGCEMRDLLTQVPHLCYDINMTKLELLVKYLNQIDPYRLADSFEIWYDLKDRVGKGTVFEYNEEELRKVIARTYYSYIPSHRQLAIQIFRALEKY